jgi:PEP-CTERM motif
MMKMRFVVFVSLVLATALAVPAVAQNEIYDNGPINGTNDAWTINFGFAVSDSFTVSGGNSTVTGLTFGSFMLPGDVLTSVELSITSSEFGGTSYFDQVVSITQSDCFANQYGYNICHQNATFNGPTLANGTYWLTLDNATTNTGDPAYWDENSGVGCQSNGCPSSASENSIGTIPSESFTLYGHSAGTGSTPEPGSIMLFGSGLLGVVGVLRRKWF